MPTYPKIVLPNLSPLEATNKVNKGSVGAIGGAGGVGTSLIYLWSTLDCFPAEWKSDPQAIMILTGFTAALFAGLFGWIGAYMAGD